MTTHGQDNEAVVWRLLVVTLLCALIGDVAVLSGRPSKAVFMYVAALVSSLLCVVHLYLGRKR